LAFSRAAIFVEIEARSVERDSRNTNEDIREAFGFSLEIGIMLRSSDRSIGLAVDATDGEIGTIKDFYFDDYFWRIRYIVVDLGNWLVGRQVLISPEAIAEFEDGSVRTVLSKEQVRHSPDIDTAKPITRQHEEEVRRYFSWPYYWNYDTSRHPEQSRINTTPVEEGASEGEKDTKGEIPNAEESQLHLQSIKEIKGYRIRAIDHDIGHVDDFIFDDNAWALRYFVIDTRNWLPGKHVLAACPWVERIEWNVSKITFPVTRERIRSAPEYHRSEPITKAYETALFQHYDKPGYWG